MADGSAGWPFWLRFVPARWRSQLQQRRELQKAVANVGWLGAQTALEAALGLLVGIWVARALGPTQYGMLSYALAFVSLLSPLATVGVSLTVVRDLVRRPEAALEIMGTATFLRALGSVVLVVTSLVAISALRPAEPMTWLLVAVVASGYAIRNLATFELWFSAKVQAKYTVVSRSVAAITGAVLKSALVVTGASLSLFFIAYSVELALATLSMLVVYNVTSGAKVTSWRVRGELARKMFADSWPLIFAGFASFIYMKVDQVMLGELRDEAAVGIYAVGARLSEAFHLLPSFVFASVFPSLIKARTIDHELYLSRFQRLYDIFVWFAVVAGLIMQFAAYPVVTLLYGDAFANAAPVLAIHIWSGVFWFSGSVGHRYLISENHTRITLLMMTAGAIVNVLANAWLIPPLGALGAAYATLASFAVSHGVAAAVFKPSRLLLVFFLRALYLPGLVRRWARLLAP